MRGRAAVKRFSAELAALVQEHCFYKLEAPIERVTGWDTPYPHVFEWQYFPGPQRVADALRIVLGRRPVARAEREQARHRKSCRQSLHIENPLVRVTKGAPGPMRSDLLRDVIHVPSTRFVGACGLCPTSCAIFRMYSGVVPQQPPTIAAPRSTNCFANGTIWSGV